MLGTLLQQPNSSSDGVNLELGWDLRMLYLICMKDLCSHWLSFNLLSVIPSVIVSISISVFIEVSVLSFGLELVDIVNHC